MKTREEQKYDTEASDHLCYDQRQIKQFENYDYIQNFFPKIVSKYLILNIFTLIQIILVTMNFEILDQKMCLQADVIKT